MENKTLTVTLTVNEWNVVLNALGQRPFAEVANVIQLINDQAKAQLGQPQESDPE